MRSEELWEMLRIFDSYLLMKEMYFLIYKSGAGVPPSIPNSSFLIPNLKMNNCLRSRPYYHYQSKWR